MNKKERKKRQIAFKDMVGHKHYYKRLGAVKYHSDGYKHFMVKSAIGYLLRKNDMEFATEIEFPNGRLADVVDLHHFYVYEVETNASEKDVAEKLGNFWDYETVADTIVIDPTEAPENLDDLLDWVEDQVLLR